MEHGPRDDEALNMLKVWTGEGKDLGDESPKKSTLGQRKMNGPLLRSAGSVA